MVINAYNELGLPLTDFNGPHQLGAMQSQTISQDGERVSTNNAFIQPIRYKRKNLTVKVNSEVVKILIDEHNVAYGVKYVNNGRTYTAFAKKEVIVSGGSINSPKLLMLSGIGPKHHLSRLNIPVKQHLAVGENLHDHVTFNGYLIALPNETSTLVSPKEVLEEVYEYDQMEIKDGPMAYNGLVNSIAFFKSDPHLPAPDVQVHVDNAFTKEFLYEPVASDSITIFPTAFYNGIIPRIMNLTPKSRGKLLLNPKNPSGPPLLYSGYFEDPTDLIPIVKIVRLYLTLEKTKAFRSCGAHFVKETLPACKEYEWGSDEYTVCLARAYTSSPYHPVGTCKMGPEFDRKAVVDPRLRVYGVSGLRVIDSSIMPFVVRGNTNAPSIMIGERGVDFVIDDWLREYHHYVCEKFCFLVLALNVNSEEESHIVVLPYFKKSENNLDIKKLNLSRKYHGVGGDQAVSIYPYVDDPSRMIVEAFHERGLPIADYNGPEQVATMESQGISVCGVRMSTNHAFIQPIRNKRKNLTVKVKSEVIKVLINRKKVAYGVKYIRNGTVCTAFAKKEVILCGGAINTPKLLMLSGVGPKDHLSKLNIKVIKDLAVGENLHDHVTFNGITIALNKSSTLVDQDVILDVLRKNTKTKVKRGPIAANGPVNALAFIKTEPNLIAPDIQYHIGHIYLDEYIRELALSDSLPIFPTMFYDGMLPRAMNLVPKSRGKLLLNATNPHGHPLIYANYLKDPSDLIPVIKGVRFLLSLEKTKAFKARGAYFVKKLLEPCTNHTWGTDEYLTCLGYAYTSATHHQGGTCKMGPKSDKKAVVDPKLRVYGVDRLRVIDAGIMPVVVRGNTNAASIMIGERGVAFVIDYWTKRNYKIDKY